MFKQIEDSAGVMETTGKGLTVMVEIFSAELHPRLEPYTENTEFMAGSVTATPPFDQVV